MQYFSTDAYLLLVITRLLSSNKIYRLKVKILIYDYFLSNVDKRGMNYIYIHTLYYKI